MARKIYITSLSLLLIAAALYARSEQQDAYALAKSAHHLCMDEALLAVSHATKAATIRGDGLATAQVQAFSTPCGALVEFEILSTLAWLDFETGSLTESLLFKMQSSLEAFDATVPPRLQEKAKAKTAYIRAVLYCQKNDFEASAQAVAECSMSDHERIADLCRGWLTKSCLRLNDTSKALEAAVFRRPMVPNASPQLIDRVVAHMERE